MSDTTDDMMVFDPEIEYEELRATTEKRWKAGWHLDQGGNRKKLKDLPAQHLVNIVKYFSATHDTTPIEKELSKRNGILRK